MSDYTAHQICESFWHDEAHSFHSVCPSCGGRGNRKHEEHLAQERHESFVRAAGAWARENGWIPPAASPDSGTTQ